jgi:DNA helicase II / ATP-dependent DNA helicase PcrA
VREVLSSLREKPLHGMEALQEWLATVSLDKDDRPGQNGDDLEKKKGVSLITMHAAKGLEFPIVYLVGLEEGILPHKRSLEEKTVPEERRLFYVGITRAQVSLTLSYCGTRVRFKDRVPCIPSSFIGELDPQYIEVISYDDIYHTPMSDEELDDEFEKWKAMLGED